MSRLLRMSALLATLFPLATLQAQQPPVDPHHLPAAAPAGESLPSGRAIVQRAMLDRPGDPWPRGLAHVVLAKPGSQQPEKAYHEPGGSFSPAVNSFGVSIWVRDASGRLKTTSDALPMSQLRQQFFWFKPQEIPAIVTTTPHYEAAWSCGGPGNAALRLASRGDPQERLELVIRSVGPAGGPINKIVWDGTRLRINDTWTVAITPRPKAVWIGHEGDADWTTQRTQARSWTGGDGWGCARIELAGAPCKVTLRNSVPPQPNPLRCPAVRARLTLELPDARFVDCLQAQAAHLLMGLLDRRTPPGEPTNYPLAWQRDGVAVVAGLARAGQTGVVRQLAEYFAENDFFGGFGAEGDAPGQGLRVLEDVAGRLHDTAFDRWLWPHVERKAGLVLKMAAADQPMRMPYAGPIVPVHRKRNDLDLVCEAARDGLIMGRMDFGIRSSYITAVSCSGLRGAAALAGRLNHLEEAGRWRAVADGLQQAWLKKTQWAEQRTYISGLWPTWVAAPEKSAYRDHLGQFGKPEQFEPWTYFIAAAGHQWVFLDEPARAWETLEWFWNHQTSPGLYTWWEGTGEENTFHLWEKVRGWVKPPCVTPHYWTAGEMLAMQVDMLAYVDESQCEPVLVIGGGVPAAWVTAPMRVCGLPTRAGLVDWNWKDGRMQVNLQGRPIKIRLGPAFGPSAQLEIMHASRFK
jgi:hypothetical protein